MSAKIEKQNRKASKFGKFMIWADEISLSKRNSWLVFLVLFAGIIASHQISGWSLLNETRAAALEKSELPVFSPGKEMLSDAALRCNENENGLNGAIGRYSFKQFAFKKNAEQLVQDKPMKEMLDTVAERDIDTASYLVAIAKKESNLGKFSPKDANGKDCYNYWGFRGTQNQTKSGYSCFDSPEQAVEVVGNRIQTLSQIQEKDTPREMVVWKCGATCAGHNPVDVKKWISDVALYYEKLNL